MNHNMALVFFARPAPGVATVDEVISALQGHCKRETETAPNTTEPLSATASWTLLYARTVTP